MRSIILCEGKDDLWFIAYFLHKTDGWVIDKDFKKTWPYYKIKPKDHTQDVQYITSDANHTRDYASIWAVGGRDRMQDAINDILHINSSYPHSMIESIVIIKDCDARKHDDVVNELATWFSDTITLENHKICKYTISANGQQIAMQIMPIVIPFDSEGAIETVLLHALAEHGAQESFIAAQASKYVHDLIASEKLSNYLTHNRQITKAEYSAAIAITNPDHSTELFKGLVMACPWEETKAIATHYGCISTAIASCQ